MIGVPDPADIRRRVARGRTLYLPLDDGMTMPEASAVARTLKAALGPDVTVFASPPRGQGPTVTVMQLLSDQEAERVRPDLDRLVAEFRRTAGALAERMGASGDGDDTESVWHDGATWHLYPHGEHCEFTNAVSGEVVEVNIYNPDAVDPYFLLQYAETSGRHQAVVDVCAEGFHDMCRLLDLAGITYR